MSVKAINWAFELRIPPIPKLILLVLADYADENGYSFPGMDKIAYRASIDERTAIRHINVLEEKGFLTRERRHIENGNRTSNGYQLHHQVTDWHIDQVTESVDKMTTVSSTEEPPVRTTSNNNSARARTWPPDLTWNNAHSLKASAHGVDVEVEFEKFRDYHLAKGSRFVDWDRAFHSWLNNAKPEPGGKRADIRRDRDQEIREVLTGSLGLDQQAREIDR